MIDGSLNFQFFDRPANNKMNKRDNDCDIKYIPNLIYDINYKVNLDEVTKEKLDILKEADHIFISNLRTYMTELPPASNGFAAEESEVIVDGKKILACCANGAGSSLMMKMTLQKVLTKLYKPFLLNNFRVIFMDIPSAEMTKYAANSMLATKISFMNEISRICELRVQDYEVTDRLLDGTVFYISFAIFYFRCRTSRTNINR